AGSPRARRGLPGGGTRGAAPVPREGAGAVPRSDDPQHEGVSWSDHGTDVRVPTTSSRFGHPLRLTSPLTVLTRCRSPPVHHKGAPDPPLEPQVTIRHRRVRVPAATPAR